MVVNELDDVTPLQPMFGHVTGENGVGVDFEFDVVVDLSGTKVTRRVLPRKCSRIQIVVTRSETPLGPRSAPRISKKSPNLVVPAGVASSGRIWERKSSTSRSGL